MKLSGTERFKINLVILGISMITWLLLLVNPGHIMTMEHCHVSATGPSAASLNMLLQMNPFSSQLMGWGLMVVAMMLPKLIVPVQAIYLQSLRRNRFRYSLLFVLGYLTVWMAAGVFMVGIIIGLNLLMPGSYFPAFGVLMMAVVWQFSPVKQKFLNLSHDHYALRAFGWEAYRDSLNFGVKHGFWCVGSGWALMLFPMLLPQGHNLAMVVVTYIMLAEHLENPAAKIWRIRVPLKLLKYTLARTQIRLQELR
jgi:predicted metal-binding membrane protein